MNDLRSCIDYLHDALVREMANRGADPSLSWIEKERMAVAVAANEWAAAHGMWRRVTVADIERIEGQAIGHFDYARKLCLYVAEMVIGRVPS